jgi:hypothetical protein
MKKILIIMVGLLLAVSFSMAVMAQEEVTPDEIVAKVKEAADYLEENGDAVLDEFKDAEGPWAWKNTYVFVFDCDGGVSVANIFPDVVGIPIAEVVGDEGRPVGTDLCEAADANADGYWVEYMWPEAGTGMSKKKISYVYRKPGTKYTVGAGIYSPEGVTADSLNEGL